MKKEIKKEELEVKFADSTFDPFDTSPFITKANNKGEPVVLPITENIIRAMEALPTISSAFRLNGWTLRKETNFSGGMWRIVTDYDYIQIKRELVNNFPFSGIQMANSASIEDGTTYLMNINLYDPMLEYFQNLEWDKIPRIENLINVFDTEDTETSRLFITSWILGMVKRIIEPGSKYDYVLVLEGEQGIGKSLFFHTLSDVFNKNDENTNHVETTLSIDNKDFYMQLIGRMIIEFTEGEIFSKSSQESIKAVITKRIDTFRPPFGKETVDNPRRFVFAMTTNSKEYLRDDSGARRWLPITCGERIDINYVKNNRDQIFAEAYYRLTVLKEKLPNVETKEAREEQLKRKINYSQEDWIINWYLNLSDKEKINGISTKDAFDSAIISNNTYEKLDKRMEVSIGIVLRNTLRLERRQIYEKGNRYIKYYPTNKTKEFISKVNKESGIIENAQIEELIQKDKF